MNRRRFLASSSTTAMFLASGMPGKGDGNVSDTPLSPELSFGIITDLHYADKDPWNTRYYRDSAEKLRRAVGVFKDENAAFVIELGDLIDKAEKDIEYGYLETIDGIFDSFNGHRYYVLGNHDVATFSKAEFMRACGMEKNYYSFDLYGHHFIVLDANYNSDGSPYLAGNFDWTETYIPKPQLAWLEGDLERASDMSTIVFIHQNLHDETDPHGVKNAPEVRRVLENAGNVRVCFQGHMHTGGRASVNGIEYFTFRASVEGPGMENRSFAIVRLKADGSISVEGHGKQPGGEITAS